MKVALLVVIAACATPVPPSEGAKLYQKLCAVCHGADGTGYKADHAPSLVSSTFLESASDEFLRRGIVYGRPGTAMAGYGKVSGGTLDDDQVAKLVGWLRSHGPAPVPMPASGGGDATRGEPLYAKNCKTCHGDRSTRGDGVYLANPRFLEAATDSFLRWAIVHGRPGTKMAAWQGKLDDAEIADVVAYVRSLAHPPPLAALPPPTGHEPIVINPSGKPPSFDVKGDRFVAAAQVKQALDDQRQIVIVDARPASDWMHVHITGAVSIPYLDMTRLSEIPKDAWVVAYCACPHHLSGIIVDELRGRGYSHAFVLDEGILEWHRRAYPIVAAPGVEPPPKELPKPAGLQ